MKLKSTLLKVKAIAIKQTDDFTEISFSYHKATWYVADVLEMLRVYSHKAPFENIRASYCENV